MTDHEPDALLPSGLAPLVDWTPLRLGHHGGYVVVARPLDPDRAVDGACYWCGHAGWTRFAGCLEYLDLHTRRLTPAPVAVYDTAWGAMTAWTAYQRGVHDTGRPVPVACELTPVNSIPDRTTVPPPHRMHPRSRTLRAAC